MILDSSKWLHNTPHKIQVGYFALQTNMISSEDSSNTYFYLDNVYLFSFNIHYQSIQSSIFPFEIHVSLFLKIDFLQQKNQDLQTQLDKSLSKARSAIDLDARNYELTKELQDVDVMAAQLQREKDKIMHAADLEINQAKVKHDNYWTYFWSNLSYLWGLLSTYWYYNKAWFKWPFLFCLFIDIVDS